MPFYRRNYGDPPPPPPSTFTYFGVEVDPELLQGGCLSLIKVDMYPSYGYLVHCIYIYIKLKNYS